MKKLSLLVLLFSISSNALHAQIEIDNHTFNPQFFVTIIAGVLLALIFQLLLTALSVAGGISMVGNVKQSFVDSRVKPNDSKNKDNYQFDQDYNSDTATGVKVSTGFGIWSLITTALSLFGASILALNLSFSGDTMSNITVALVIWALFFIILFYLEARIVNTVIGSLITTVTSGLKSSLTSVKEIFETSQEKKLNQTIDHTIDKVRQELNVDLNTSELSNTLDKFLNKVDNKLPDYDRLINDLQGVAKKSKSKNTSGKYMAIQQVLSNAIEKADNGNSEESKGKVDKLKTLLSELEKAYNSDDSTAEGIKDIITEYSDQDKSQIDQKIKEIKNYISSATPENLSQEKLDQDFQKILTDPKAAGAILSSEFNDFNKDKIVKLIASNTNLEKEQLDTYASRIENTIGVAKEKAESLDISSLTESSEKKISDFLENTDREELNYEDLKTDINSIYNNPKDSLSVIKSRLNKMDAETVKALIKNNKYIDEKDIDTVTSTITETLENIKTQVNSIEQKAHEQIQMTKRKAVIQAEHARKTAASAAWWLVITIIVSGGASMLGAWLELF